MNEAAESGEVRHGNGRVHCVVKRQVHRKVHRQVDRQVNRQVNRRVNRRVREEMFFDLTSRSFECEWVP